MKKLFLLLATAAVTSGAYAEGYQVNNLSSKQNGMGHVGTAMKLNSESIWFNPAAASFQHTRFDISVGITEEFMQAVQQGEYSAGCFQRGTKRRGFFWPIVEKIPCNDLR